VIEIVLALGFLVAVCLNFLNVIGRYVVGYYASGTDEIQIYIMVWMAFVGAAIITWRDVHFAHGCAVSSAFRRACAQSCAVSSSRCS